MSCSCQSGTTIHSSIYAALVIIALALYSTMDKDIEGQAGADFAQTEAGLDVITVTEDDDLGDFTSKSLLVDRR